MKGTHQENLLTQKLKHSSLSYFLWGYKIPTEASRGDIFLLFACVGLLKFTFASLAYGALSNRAFGCQKMLLLIITTNANQRQICLKYGKTESVNQLCSITPPDNRSVKTIWWNNFSLLVTVKIGLSPNSSPESFVN